MAQEKYDRINQIVERRKMLGHSRTFAIEALQEAEQNLEKAKSSVRSIEEEDSRLAKEYSVLMNWV